MSATPRTLADWARDQGWAGPWRQCSGSERVPSGGPGFALVVSADKRCPGATCVACGGTGQIPVIEGFNT